MNYVPFYLPRHSDHKEEVVVKFKKNPFSTFRSDRSRSRYDSYDEERYSPPPHNNYTGRRHSREWSPDR
jgi:hypothetical protein